MLPGPVFNIELLTLARRARYFVLRTCYGLLLLLLIWQQDPGQRGYVGSGSGEISIQAMSALGLSLFFTFAWTQSLVVLLMTPALVAGVIAEERQRKTLHYLLASRLSSAEIVLGKLCARGLHLATYVAMGMPILALLTLFGGVDPNVMLLFFAATATTIFFLAAVAILASIYARRPRDAVVLTYLLELVWLFGPSLALWALPAAGDDWGDSIAWVRTAFEWVGHSSPFFILTHDVRSMFAGGDSFLEGVAWMMGLQSALGALLATIAVLRLRPAFRKEGGEARRSSSAAGWLARRFRFRPKCGDDPMLWKEIYVSKAGWMTRALGGFVLVTVLALVGYLSSDTVLRAWEEFRNWGYGSGGAPHARRELNMLLRFLTTLTAGFLLLWVASAAAYGLAGEREGDTWLSLVSTPLTAMEIVRAKMLGAFRSTFMLLLVWLGLMSLGLVLGAIHPLGALTATFATMTYLSFGCALGTFYSLRARSSARAATATVLTLIVLNVGYLLVLVPWRWESTIGLVGLTPFVEAVSLLSYEDVHSLFNDDLQRWEFDATITCVASVALYGVATVVLAALTVGSFDAVIDRTGPRSAARHARSGKIPVDL